MSSRVYYMDDCNVTLPDGFRDRTAHALEYKTEEGDSIALVFQREPLPGLGKDPGADRARALDRYVEATTQGYPSRFVGLRFERDEVAGGDPGGLEMRRKTFRHKQGDDVLYQHQAFVLAGDAVLVVTAGSKARHRTLVDQLVDQTLGSLRFREQ
jgi:hypothetical protein